MNTYFKDYKDLCKHVDSFNRKHWKGNAVVFIVSTAICVAPIVVTAIKNKIELEKNKKEESKRIES